MSASGSATQTASPPTMSVQLPPSGWNTFWVGAMVGCLLVVTIFCATIFISQRKENNACLEFVLQRDMEGVCRYEIERIRTVDPYTESSVFQRDEPYSHRPLVALASQRGWSPFIVEEISRLFSHVRAFGPAHPTEATMELVVRIALDELARQTADPIEAVCPGFSKLAPIVLKDWCHYARPSSLDPLPALSKCERVREVLLSFGLHPRTDCSEHLPWTVL